MDVNANLILMQYFENAKDLKPGEFVLLREGKVIDPLIHGKFTKEHHGRRHFGLSENSTILYF